MLSKCCISLVVIFICGSVVRVTTTVAVTVGLIYSFAPTMLLALVVTMSRKNWKILYQHPYIILLPVFTFFTIAKNKVSCGGPSDSRLVFSKRFTYGNIILSLISAGGVCVWRGIDTLGAVTWIANGLLPVLSAVLTILFMHMPGCSCCGGCGCCNIHNDVHMYDPASGLVQRQAEEDVDVEEEDGVEMADV